MIDAMPRVLPVKLRRQYKFMYENFVVATQYDVYLLLEMNDDTLNCLRFNSSRLMKYGSPNDEAIGGHPLCKFGLKPTVCLKSRIRPGSKSR